MKYFMISTLPESDARAQKAVRGFMEAKKDTEIAYTDTYRLGACIGCMNCWLKTPGICCLKDDWALLFKKILKADCVIFLTEAKLGFVSFKLKNVVDRLIPLVLPYTEIRQGEARHSGRYEKRWRFGLVYAGDGDQAFLREWMERLALNFRSDSIGTYNINESGELLRELEYIQLLSEA